MPPCSKSTAFINLTNYGTLVSCDLVAVIWILWCLPWFKGQPRYSQSLPHTWALMCQIRPSPPHVAPVRSSFPPPESFYYVIHIFDILKIITSSCWFEQKAWDVLGVNTLTYIKTKQKKIIVLWNSWCVTTKNTIH